MFLICVCPSWQNIHMNGLYSSQQTADTHREGLALSQAREVQA